jgi:hypothetical protein
VGALVGAAVGLSVGVSVGSSVGVSVGALVGAALGALVGAGVGGVVGPPGVGERVGAVVASISLRQLELEDTSRKCPGKHSQITITVCVSFSLFSLVTATRLMQRVVSASQP